MGRLFFIFLVVLMASTHSWAERTSTLIQRTTHRKAKIRLSATLALKNFDTPKVVAALSRRLSSDSQKRIRLAAALSLNRVLAQKRSTKKHHKKALAALKKASTQDTNKKVRDYCIKTIARHSKPKALNPRSEKLAVSVTFKSKELSTGRQNVLLNDIKKLLAKNKQFQLVRGFGFDHGNDHYNLGFRHAPLRAKKSGLTATITCKISVRASVIKDQKETWQNHKMAIATSSAEVIGPATRHGIRSSKETCLLSSMKHATQKELIPFLLAKSN